MGTSALGIRWSDSESDDKDPACDAGASHTKDVDKEEAEDMEALAEREPSQPEGRKEPRRYDAVEDSEGNDRVDFDALFVALNCLAK